MRRFSTLLTPVERAGDVPYDGIPTLEIEVLVPEIPVLDTPVAGVRKTPIVQLPYGQDRIRTRVRQLPRRSSRRASRWIIATVAVGLLAAASIASVLDKRVFEGSDVAADNTPARRPEVQMPTLVLLEESLRAPLPLVLRTPLLQSVAELLKASDLHDQVTIDFAMQSLKSMLLTDADNNVARYRLEDLTRRLANEARFQFDQGNARLARRLVEQASKSGVVRDYVRVAADYIAAPKPDVNG